MSASHTIASLEEKAVKMGRDLMRIMGSDYLPMEDLAYLRALKDLADLKELTFFASHSGAHVWLRDMAFTDLNRKSERTRILARRGPVSQHPSFLSDK